MKQERINVVCNLDDGYSAYCGTMLTSLFENNSNLEIVVYLVTDYISEKNKHLFSQLVEKYKQTIFYIEVDKSFFTGLPYGGKFSNISLATYYRLLIPQVLPKNIGKVLYLDCDIIISGDIRNLWGYNLEGYSIAALEDRPDIAGEAVKRLCYPESDSYFNSGVLLMNLQRLNQNEFTQKALSYMNQYRDRILFHDQDVLNALLHDDKKFFSLEYNMMECFLMKDPIIPMRYKEQLSKVIYRPIIIHYTGAVKPWHVECQHPYKSKYEYYHNISPWSHVMPVRKYKGVKAQTFFLVKGLIKNILSLFGNGQYVYRKM